MPDVNPDIHRLYEVIKTCEEVIPFAKLAADHFRDKRRPLKIAVDESTWRYKNVPHNKVKNIQKTTPESNPVEKAMFWKICNLLRLNIDLVFVFDGPDIPNKPGRRPRGTRDNDGRKLLKKLLSNFCIPYIEVPDEAEAECCQLQTLGLVDAVWSDDSDCLLFGCSLWIRDNRIGTCQNKGKRAKGQTKKDNVNFCVVGADNIHSKERLKREDIILLAILAGGDYDRIGLRGCGSETAKIVAQSSIGRNLCKARNQGDCDRWREQFTTLQYYRDPRVRAEAAHRSNPQLASEYRRSIDEQALFDMTNASFNTWGKGYMDWIVPTLLTSMLVDRDVELPEAIIDAIESATRRKKKKQPSTDVVRTITFSPFTVTKLAQSLFVGDDRKFWVKHDEKPFEPEYKVTCDIPTYLLAKVLPHEALHPAPPAPKCKSVKRKRDTDEQKYAKKPALTNKQFQEIVDSILMDSD